MERRQLLDLIVTNDPDVASREVARIVRMIDPCLDLAPVNRTFRDVLRLFRGRYPGYRACNTFYHDLPHTLSAWVAMARLVHGAILEGFTFRADEIRLGLVAALLHDTGYIQDRDDTTGTGAKYTREHEERSILFMRDYFRRRGFSERDAQDCRDLLDCTGLTTAVGEIAFRTPALEVLGKMLGTADLLGQMSERCYLEKLLLLYWEFQEGGVPGFAGDLDLLRKTPGFCQVVRRRLDTEYSGVRRYLHAHFRARWGEDADLYDENIARNLAYLDLVLAGPQDRFRDRLRRDGVTAKLRLQAVWMGR